jgi:hypothetical protein
MPTEWLLVLTQSVTICFLLYDVVVVFAVVVVDITAVVVSFIDFALIGVVVTTVVIVLDVDVAVDMH